MNLTHSFSALKMYENCPRRYMHQRINKEVKDEGSDASKYGERIHEALELRIRDKSPLTDETQKYEPLCTALEQEAKGGKLLAEQKMTLNKNLMPTEWFAPDAWFRSILDVLMIHESQKKAFVLDWKTGKRRPDFTQMEIFALQVFKHYPEVDSVTSALVWLRDYKMDTQVYKREQSNEMWARIMARVNRIYESLEHDTWPPKPSGLCPWCPAKHICDYAQL
jgi:hypothetical protein|tara:strand:+ start:4906 stop:5571 length:666 start_codon:yes stop_codon:yes gene_type:complete